ncbi:MAG: phosphoribosylformylglycinamidine synthase [Thermoleophilia bacterium]|nr:phosphoribosylformylglycinamidine synthase [Thermoleophilia bacterium]
MIGVRIRTMPKRAVLDPQGEAVVRGLRMLGHDVVRDARVGRVVELVLDLDDEADALAAAERMCADLLVNDVVEYGEVELVDASAIVVGVGAGASA